MAQRGVRMGWLTESFVPMAMEAVGLEATTGDVCFRMVIPQSLERECRYVDLLDPDDVGDSHAFASHCWGARFIDLVASLAHVLEPHQFVWIDIFAVLQHEHTAELKAIKGGDLDFVPIVQACRLLIFFGMHLPSVENMASEDANMRRVYLVPERERKRCGFLRVWCLVELAAALAVELPVVMLVGAAELSGNAGNSIASLSSGVWLSGFEPEDGMLENMYHLVDANQAEATVESDATFIFETLMPKALGTSGRSESVARINSLAKGAIIGAENVMRHREVVQATAGNMAPLRTLSSAGKVRALRAAASAGLLAPMRELIDMGVNVRAHSSDEDVQLKPLTRLREAEGGPVSRLREAVRDWRVERTGSAPIILAAEGGHVRALELLLDAKASINQQSHVEGGTPLSQAAVGGHRAVLELLIARGADPRPKDEDGMTALLQASAVGDVEIVQMLLTAKSDLQHRDKDGMTGGAAATRTPPAPPASDGPACARARPRRQRSTSQPRTRTLPSSSCS